MHTFMKGRAVTSTVALTYLFMVTLASYPVSAMAQTPDTNAPIIDFQAVSQGVKGDSQVFTATVTDEGRLNTVSLYYRFSDEQPYVKEPMRELGSTGIYTVTVETDSAPQSSEFIQYYMEAIDASGNRALQGFAFDPIERQLLPTQSAVAPLAVTAPEAGLTTGQKILYGALGLLVVGALAAAAGGGGGGSVETVPVTVVVDSLQ